MGCSPGYLYQGFEALSDFRFFYKGSQGSLGYLGFFDPYPLEQAKNYIIGVFDSMLRGLGFLWYQGIRYSPGARS